MQLAGMDQLAPGTQAQYQRAFRWFQREYAGPCDRTEPMQVFLNQHPKCKGIQGRIIQSVINRHLRPRPAGPPITIVVVPQSFRKKIGKSGKVLDEEHAWAVYLPIHLHGSIMRDLTPSWHAWLQHYIVHTLHATPLRKNLVRTYVTHVYKVLVEELQCSNMGDILRISHADLVHAVARCNPVRVHQRRLCRIALNHFLSSTVLREHPPLGMRLHLRAKDFTSTPVDPPDGDGDHPAEFAVRAPGRVRDHFTQSEMDTLLNLPGLSLRDRLMLHIMAETGLRRRAVSWLLVDCIFDRAAQCCLPVGRALEKGLVMRPFTLSQHTASLLCEYMLHEHPGPHSRWLFPSCKKGNMYPVTPSVVNSVLLRACAMANICGRHTHTHAIRKFVVCTLMQHKNRIEVQVALVADRHLNVMWPNG
jgi:integrase